MRESMVATTGPATTSDLVMRWAPVVGADGRSGLVARWVPAGQLPAVAHPAA